MKYIIISDLHEDIHSLLKILNSLINRDNIKLISLGDNIGISKKYYSHIENDANSCLSLMKDNGFVGVRGNHDNFHLKITPKQTIFLYPELLYNSSNLEKRNIKNKVWSFCDEEPTYLTKKNIDYLAGFDEYIIEDKILFSHFLFPDITGSTKLKEIDLRKILDIHFLYMSFNDISYSFIGHLHVKEVIVISEKRGRLNVKNNFFKFEMCCENERFVVFCPSIIQNRIYLEYNSDNKLIKIINL